ncbi:hypothetical protein QQF21_17290 [Lelliottia sp. V89_10]|uniref:tail fiber/spike domain-containing protein n=1 Tax=Lelliottia wanjuensis TaxID=3050585 RepID=UPI00249DE1E1|nr:MULTISPECIES: hypothetical protein [unclassified Lelliottia]MDI3359788.1 hypothetical protein [Lelliottia sp. V89_13]MDK9548746.1 hypothetical protein [Lelliottia sp. V89_5]MDK9597378.1 hypothetical protein [Lelliottia sp. V89_10]
MTQYHTGNKIGSTDPRDLYDNSQNLDSAVNDTAKETWKDRLDKNRKTWFGMEQFFERLMADFENQMKAALIAAGYQLIDSFQEGATLTQLNQALRWKLPDGDGEYYRWDGPLPKVVPQGSTPTNTGGVKTGAWVGVGDASLRAQLASTVGAGMVDSNDGFTLQQFIDLVDYQRNGDIRGFGVTTSDITPINAYINSGENPRTLKIPRGSWLGNVVLGKGFGVSGDSLITTTITVPKDAPGISASGDELRGVLVENLDLSVAGAVSGGLPIGVGAGLDLSGVAKAVNCTFSNIYLDYFDLGYKAGPADFSNTYRNVRASNNRIGFYLSSNGQIINNVFDGVYVSSWTELGMYIAGANNCIFNAANFGSTGLPSLSIALNSRGIVFVAPNFEMDSGILPANSQVIVAQSDTESVFESPSFVKASAATGLTTYLVRARDTAVVRINNPRISLEGGNIKHLSIEGNATVYLFDPKNVFTEIDISGNGKLIRVTEALDNSPGYTGNTVIVPGTIVHTGFYSSRVMVEPDFHSASVPANWKYKVFADTYTSTGFTCRVIDTTTGGIITNPAISIPISIVAWR